MRAKLDKKKDTTADGNRAKQKQLPLTGKRLFLHLQGYRGATRIEKDLITLGATVEKCFSKDVNFVITNCGSPADYEKAKKATADLSSPSPMAPSPFNMAYTGVDSPQAGSPSHHGESQKPITRGKAMAAAAKTRSHGSSDVIEMARRFKLRIHHIDRIVPYIAKETAKLPTSVKVKEQGAPTSTKVRKLRGVYMKFEASNRNYRPVHQELQSMPKMYLNSLPWTCPFTKARQSSRIDERGEGEEEERDGQGVPDDALELDETTVKIFKRKHKEEHEAGVAFFGSPMLTAREMQRLQAERKHAEMKRGYCEVCQTKYDNIDVHVRSTQHKQFVSNNNNYAVLDQMIATGPDMDQFTKDILSRHQKKASKIRDTSLDEVLLVTEYQSPAVTTEHSLIPGQSKSSKDKSKPNVITTSASQSKHTKSTTKSKTPNSGSAAAPRSVPKASVKRPECSNNLVTTPITRRTTPRRACEQSSTKTPVAGPDETPKKRRSTGTESTPKKLLVVVTPVDGQDKSSQQSEQRTVKHQSGETAAESQASPMARTGPADIGLRTRQSRRPSVSLQSPQKVDDKQEGNTDEHEGNTTPHRGRKFITQDKCSQRQSSEMEGVDECRQTRSKRKFVPEHVGSPQKHHDTSGVLEHSPATRRQRRSMSRSGRTPQKDAANEKEHSQEPIELSLVKSGSTTAVFKSLRPKSLVSTQEADDDISNTSIKGPTTCKTNSHVPNHLTDGAGKELVVLCSPLNLSSVKHYQNPVTEAVSVSGLLASEACKSNKQLTSSQRITNIDDRGYESKTVSPDKNVDKTKLTSIISEPNKDSSVGAKSVVRKKSEVDVSQVAEVGEENVSYCGPVRKVRSSHPNLRNRQRSTTVYSRSAQSVLKADTHECKVSSKPDTNSKLSGIVENPGELEEKENQSSREGKDKPVVDNTKRQSERLVPRQNNSHRNLAGAVPALTSTPNRSGSKHVKLATDRSMKRMFSSGSEDGEFQGFTSVTSNIPSDTSYDSVEVSVASGMECGVDDHEANRVVAIISEGLDCTSQSSPIKATHSEHQSDCTLDGTPIKNLIGNVSLVSEASSTGWDDNLDNFLDDQVKMHKMNNGTEVSGTCTLSLVNIGSQSGNPRHSPRRSSVKCKSPFKFTTSPLTKMSSTPADKARNLPFKHTPATSNTPTVSKVLDFSKLSFLNNVGEDTEGADFWVGSTKEEKLSLSYIQKMAMGRVSSPRTPVYHPTHQQVKFTTPKVNPHPSKTPTSHRTGGQVIQRNAVTSVDPQNQPAKQTLHTAPKQQRVTATSNLPIGEGVPRTVRLRQKIDEEIDFVVSSPTSHVGDAISKMTVSSPVTPLDRALHKTPRRLLAGKYDELPSAPNSTSNVYNLDNPDEYSETPQKKLLKSLSSNKKQFSLGHVPQFEFRSGNGSQKDKTDGHSKVGSKAEVKLADLGKSVTPRVGAKNAIFSTRVSDNKSMKSHQREVAPSEQQIKRTFTASSMQPKTPTHEISKLTPETSVTPCSSRRSSRHNNGKNTDVNTNTLNVASLLSPDQKLTPVKTPETLHTQRQPTSNHQVTPQTRESKAGSKSGLQKTPVSSTVSTPKTPASGIEKLLMLHSLEDIQFGPRRKNANNSSVVRFNYDDSDEDTSSENSPAVETNSKSTKLSSSGKRGSVKLRTANPKVSKHSSSERTKTSRDRKFTRFSAAGKRTSLTLKNIDLNKAKHKNTGQQQVCRLPHKNWYYVKVNRVKKMKHGRSNSDLILRRLVSDLRDDEQASVTTTKRLRRSVVSSAPHKKLLRSKSLTVQL